MAILVDWRNWLARRSNKSKAVGSSPTLTTSFSFSDFLVGNSVLIETSVV